MVRINWTNQAVSDLKNVYDFIASDSKFYAKRKVSKKKLNTELIKEHIRFGRMVPEFEQDDIREIIEGRYRIVYQIISSTEVDILTIHNSAKENLTIKVKKDNDQT